MSVSPRIFISYSHDSEAHKQWVAEIAMRLRHSGIDAILDQWDLRLGDDVTHFMEEGVRKSNRVLVVCTDQYIQKADARQGGVGYEGLIVTAELVNNLGTNKFIPIVRNVSGERKTPIFLATRLWIDFSNDNEFEVKFDVLLRELHSTPASVKPPLGKNPFDVNRYQPADNVLAEKPSSPRDTPIGKRVDRPKTETINQHSQRGATSSAFLKSKPVKPEMPSGTNYIIKSIGIAAGVGITTGILATLPAIFGMPTLGVAICILFQLLCGIMSTYVQDKFNKGFRSVMSDILLFCLAPTSMLVTQVITVRLYATQSLEALPLVKPFFDSLSIVSFLLALILYIVLSSIGALIIVRK